MLGEESPKKFEIFTQYLQYVKDYINLADEGDDLVGEFFDQAEERISQLKVGIEHFSIDERVRKLKNLANGMCKYIPFYVRV